MSDQKQESKKLGSPYAIWQKELIEDTQLLPELCGIIVEYHIGRMTAQEIIKKLRKGDKDFSGCRFCESDENGDLRPTDLQPVIDEFGVYWPIGCNFKNANLTGVDFSWHYFHNNDFTGANLTRVNLTGVRMISHIKMKDAIWDEVQINFESSRLDGVAFKELRSFRFINFYTSFNQNSEKNNSSLIKLWRLRKEKEPKEISDKLVGEIDYGMRYKKFIKIKSEGTYIQDPPFMWIIGLAPLKNVDIDLELRKGRWLPKDDGSFESFLREEKDKDALDYIRSPEACMYKASKVDFLYKMFEILRFHGEDYPVVIDQIEKALKNKDILSIQLSITSLNRYEEFYPHEILSHYLIYYEQYFGESVQKTLQAVDLEYGKSEVKAPGLSGFFSGSAGVTTAEPVSRPAALSVDSDADSLPISTVSTTDSEELDTPLSGSDEGSDSDSDVGSDSDVDEEKLGKDKSLEDLHKSQSHISQRI